jgi:DUF2892 family protein
MSIRALYRRNVGGLDRGIRLALGAPLLAAGLFVAGGIQGEPVGIILALAGLVGVLTGIAGRCPLYVLFGISTARLATGRPASVYQE